MGHISRNSLSISEFNSAIDWKRCLVCKKKMLAKIFVHSKKCETLEGFDTNCSTFEYQSPDLRLGRYPLWRDVCSIPLKRAQNSVSKSEKKILIFYPKAQPSAQRCPSLEKCSAVFVTSSAVFFGCWNISNVSGA